MTELTFEGTGSYKVQNGGNVRWVNRGSKWEEDSNSAEAETDSSVIY